LRSDCPAGWPWNRWPDGRGMPGQMSVDWVAGWRGIRTLEEVGQEIGLTRERVRQIQVEALKRLREILEKNGLSSDALFQ
ncbi:sigma factor-like helix-turn-helix DNA-binding protein, partial [Pseudomonas aeruginosa]|uniref:sigma factor-like helix-turn-helix DNA-binding protein n=1 Tax=Pseudomonas aeruginosa TaxID=287 RepID=UPI003D819634